MTATPDMFIPSFEVPRRRTVSELLGSVSLYFTAERTDADVRMEQALRDLQWDELSAHTLE